jgi:sulfoxide reductase heme-binding subunit YedZ
MRAGTESLPAPARRHLIVAATALVCGIVVYLLLGLSPEWWPDRSYGPRSEDTHWRLSVATGSTAVLLLGTTLTIGPVRRIRSGRAGSVHIPWRRVVGVWTAISAWTHLIFGITIHADGWRIWVPFTHLWQSQGKLRLLGAAMWVGLGAALLLAVLAATSNATSLRRLGPHRWKLLQRGAYVVAALIVVHIAGMQIQEDRNAVHVSVVAAILAGVASIQVAGFVFTRRHLRRRT